MESGVKQSRIAELPIVCFIGAGAPGLALRMSNGLKVIVYAILVIATAITGYFFFHNFGKLFEGDKPKIEASESAAPATASTIAEPVPGTNAVGAVDTNVAPATNAVADVPTNAAAGTNAVAEATTPPVAPAPPKAPAAVKPEKSRIGLWTGSFILCVIALGAFIAWDVSNYMGNKSLRLLYNDEGVGMKDPEYDEAEQIWADGKPLDAIRMMRDYLNNNPREVHVAIRIAEIYEKDLNNFLAAALEYEEVLKHKLPNERWGWAAIHLCNLYFKLGQEVKGFALLQRIVKDYGGTQAAGKARKRLSEVDPGLLAEAEGSAPAPEEEEPGAPQAPEPEEPKSNLPPGFRPKK
jgi:hypothetical protein